LNAAPEWSHFYNKELNMNDMENRPPEKARRSEQMYDSGKIVADRITFQTGSGAKFYVGGRYFRPNAFSQSF
jgi:hypothetical protein